jgi:hypothetical protein
MSEKVTRCCPNCKAEIMVTFEGGPLGKGVVKECPDCKSPIIFCPNGYIIQAATSFASRKGRNPT